MPLDFRDIAIVGGGCYGSFYASQLLRARARGKVAFRRLLIVDRNPECQAARELAPTDFSHRIQDWTDFFDDWLGNEAGAGDAIVPSPLMPHLMYQWIVRRAQARWPGRQIRTTPVDTEARTPYDMLAPDGIRYVSHADWLCPTHCIEPALCPATRAPRTWEMSDTLAELSRRMSRSATMAGPAVLRCRHRAFGVGMFDADEVLAADALVAGAGNQGVPVRILVGTVSSCHGAIGLLELGEMVAGGSILQGGPEPPMGRPGIDSTLPGGHQE
ncbi:MAG TPA: hypothetical protein VK012_04695 [Gemmatimonadales bacterium]|nr:hypothetical protein [Gemmatimonadales bacterium]